MGNPKAFLNIPRQEAGYRPVHERVADYSEVEQTLNTSERKLQASRCMDCGVPFCHWACPLGNRPPEFQDALCKGDWRKAYEILSATNDFPEFTGRICPALCEKSCVLKLSIDSPVTIREDEAAVIEAAFREGYISPKKYERNGKKVAVIGSGPAGLAAANQLNKRGYEVTVFERDEMLGGLLRYGIPNFKLGKNIIDRRLRIMEAEGIIFKTNSEIDLMKLSEGFDAYAVCTGTPQARDLSIPGRELSGIHFAMEMLAQQNRVLAGQEIAEKDRISARGKHVLVIGGGDTGSDCIGTSHRQGALSVTQIEIMPKPPVGHNPATPWPQWPVVLKTSSSHEEGCTRRWCLNSNKFVGKNGKVTAVEVEEVEWIPAADGGRPVMKPTGKKDTIKADLVLLAMGFLKPQLPELPANAVVAGDAATGPSLVVKCIAAGRKAAAEIDKMIMTN
ncbi:glutamate synthase subunit beta [Bacteroides sp. ET336]|uniref:glutamate synthase subunit beta n=1 Tax=Bacteroides sp. ET336 TaxID=2972459 RepID=UPI0021AC3B23|nr:glutamate synthase subunit beta [Bacteroides sp. ET336]MCR8894669.1 glutamate synthase subunit beta [Bacteroides sp. ET336]MDN0059165.1 glutamate synthase subunit beta [Bacteroides caecigallinarum]